MRTDLIVSKQLKEMGIAQNSEFIWFAHKENGDSLLAYKTETGCYNAKGAGFALKCFDTCDTYSAFTLSELVDVFKQIGEIKGWVRKATKYKCSRLEHDLDYSNPAWCWQCGDACKPFVYDYQIWLKKFVELCEIYATKGEEEANAYILEVIKK